MKNRPESVVIDILSKKPNISPKKTYEFFLEKYKSGISIQGFYKLLRQLQRDRVVIKNNGLLSIDISWVNNLVKFTDTVKKTYLNNEMKESTIILDEGEKNTFNFGDAIEMDNFWDHSLLLVMRYYQDKKYSDKNIYSKNFYSWIQVVRTESTVELSKSYKEFGLDWYMASNSKSFLNSLVPHLVPSDNFHFSTTKNTTGYGNGSENFHVTVIGDFIFETKLAPHLFSIVKRMFEHTNSISELNTKEIEKELHNPAKAILTITRNKKRAAEIRNEIKKLF